MSRDMLLHKDPCSRTNGSLVMHTEEISACVPPLSITLACLDFETDGACGALARVSRHT
jgi:hypothetical protein